MNTANLQLEGLLLAVSSLLDVMQRKGLLTQGEIDAALDAAEAGVEADRRSADMRHANAEAILFPIRFLREATADTAGHLRSFSERSASIGRSNGA